jgi:hypothetical protein
MKLQNVEFSRIITAIRFTARAGGFLRYLDRDRKEFFSDKPRSEGNIQNQTRP